MTSNRSRYRAKASAVRIAAIRAGIDPPSGHAIARHCQLPAATINAILAGRSPRSETMAVIVRCLGVALEELFEIVDE